MHVRFHLRRTLLLPLCLLCCPLAPTAFGAATTNVHFTIRAWVDHTAVTVGDPITYTIEIEFPPEARLRKPGPGSDLGNFEIKDYQLDPPVVSNGYALDRIRYVLAVYETGSFEIPAAEASIVLGETEQQLTADPVRITVRPLAQGRDEILDLKAPVLPAGQIPLRYFITAGVIIFVVLLFLFGPRVLARFSRSHERHIPPFEEAERALRALLRRRLFDSGRQQEFYYELSLLLRRFLERTRQVPCTVLDTSQILQAFEEQHDSELPFFRDFFKYADSVKFAGIVPTRERTAALLQEIDRLIAQARNQALAEAAQPGTPAGAAPVATPAATTVPPAPAIEKPQP